jgi:hypothetical protein
MGCNTVIKAPADVDQRIGDTRQRKQEPESMRRRIKTHRYRNKDGDNYAMETAIGGAFLMGSMLSDGGDSE